MTRLPFVIGYFIIITVTGRARICVCVCVRVCTSGRSRAGYVADIQNHPVRPIVDASSTS